MERLVCVGGHDSLGENEFFFFYTNRIGKEGGEGGEGGEQDCRGKKCILV